MKIIITIKDKENIDSTVDKILDLDLMLEKKFKDFKVERCEYMSNGISLVLEN